MSTSDSAVPYAVTDTGVALPEGVTFPAHGHINIKITTPEGVHLRDVNMHFDPNNGHPGGQFIGESFFPVSLSEGECIGWVQIHGFNEHFGEGGQDPVCSVVVEPLPEPEPGPEPDPEPTPDPEPEPEEPPVTEQPENPTPPEEPPGIPDLECAEGYVPGWLNSEGLPTSCVRDSPVVWDKEKPIGDVGELPPVPEVQVEVPVITDPTPELAETGSADLFAFGVLGVALLAAGVCTWVVSRKSRRKDA